MLFKKQNIGTLVLSQNTIYVRVQVRMN